MQVLWSGSCSRSVSSPAPHRGKALVGTDMGLSQFGELGHRVWGSCSHPFPLPSCGNPSPAPSPVVVDLHPALLCRAFGGFPVLCQVSSVRIEEHRFYPSLSRAAPQVCWRDGAVPWHRSG